MCIEYVFTSEGFIYRDFLSNIKWLDTDEGAEDIGEVKIVR